MDSHAYELAEIEKRLARRGLLRLVAGLASLLFMGPCFLLVLVAVLPLETLRMFVLAV